jgi:hypothetical protein
MAYLQPRISAAAAERSEQLARLVYELLDALADTERLMRTPRHDLLWRADLDYVRDLQRVARGVLAHAA